MYNVELEKFEGPLDLLLKLIEDNKLDITHISLSKITNSYLSEIEKIQCSSEEMAEFVVIAARLLYIKSKELLPNTETIEDEEEIADLEESLIEYQKYKIAAKRFEEILENNKRSYRRQAITEKIILFSPPKDIDQQKLFDILNDVLARNEVKPEGKTIIPQKFTLEEKRNEISRKIKKGKISFIELIKDSQTKTEVIVTFLAVLEMIKQKEVTVEQNKNFADFMLSRVK